MASKGDEPAGNESKLPSGKPEDGQGSQGKEATHHECNKKRPYLLTLIRALFLVAQILWWWFTNR
jgi:hypothetical protein